MPRIPASPQVPLESARILNQSNSKLLGG